MVDSLHKEVLTIAGLAVNVYSQPNTCLPEVPVAIMFFLHGRNGSAARIEDLVAATFGAVARHRESSTNESAHDLYIVTFDQRNHGSRLVDKRANERWNAGNPELHNPQHAIDMFAIYTGTAQDVSFLIDLLPSYLFPSTERTISQWLVAGRSLGGHAAWVTLRNDPRVRIGVPIIGCPDYAALMRLRAKRHSVPFEPPFVPTALLAAIERFDPASSTPYTRADDSNPFCGKKILVLSGRDDRIVPWSTARDFVENLNVGGDGVKEVFVEEGIGHDCSPAMVERMGRFIWRHALSTP